MKRLTAVAITVILAMGFGSSAQSATTPKAGSACTKLNSTGKSSSGTLKCLVVGKKKVWVRSGTSSNTSSNSSGNASGPASGSPCSTIGAQKGLTSDSYLECRYGAKAALTWIELNKTPKISPLAVSPTPIQACQIPEGVDPTKSQDGAMSHGFPLTNYMASRYPAAGTIHIGILPVDFTDYPGETNLKTDLTATVDKLKRWFTYFSGGKVNLDVTYQTTWIHSDKKADYFDDQASYKNLDWWSAANKIGQSYVDLAPEGYDFNKIGGLFVYHPKAQRTIHTDLVDINLAAQTKQGNHVIDVHAAPAVLLERGQEYASWVAHEMMHHVGIAGHAPGEGFPFNIMTDQNGWSQALSAWDQFLLGWLPSNQVYCVDKAKISDQTVEISPMEREDNGTKTIIVPIGPHQALVVDSHRAGTWTAGANAGAHAYSGFYGVTVYRIDTTKANDRSNESNSGSSTQNGTNDTPQTDDGNNTHWSKFAYYLPVDGGASNPQYDWGNYSPGQKVAYKYTGVVGDSFTSDGVKFTFLKTGDQDTIKISLQK